MDFNDISVGGGAIAYAKIRSLECQVGIQARNGNYYLCTFHNICGVEVLGERECEIDYCEVYNNSNFLDRICACSEAESERAKMLHYAIWSQSNQVSPIVSVVAERCTVSNS